MEEEERIITTLRSIMANMSNLMNSYYEPYGMTGVQCLVLTQLAMSEEEVKISDLAKALMMSNSNISAIIKRMEHHDLVIRQRSKTDERVVIVSLTENSKKCMEQMQKDRENQCAITKNLSIVQRNQIIDSLILLDEAIKEVANEKSK